MRFEFMSDDSCTPHYSAVPGSITCNTLPCRPVVDDHCLFIRFGWSLLSRDNHEKQNAGTGLVLT